MLRVGLTGGYATGKSFVAAELEQLGCHLIYADKLGHETLLPSGEAYGPAIQLFGSGILRPDGTIDRKALGDVVFENRVLLQRLTDLVHPAVFRLEEKLIAQFAASDPWGIVVVEAAILIETGRYRDYDRIIVTYCSLETQIARAIKRDHVTREQALARLANQKPVDEKRRFAHYLVDTDHMKEDTAASVKEIYLDLKRYAEQT
jgi:dephospho-CoA kinase